MFKREKSLMLFNLDADRYSFKGIGLFLFVYLGATLFAAIFTAPAYWAVEWLNSVSPSETTRWLLGKDIDIYFDRLRWAPIIIGLPWVLAKCKLFSLKNLGITFSLSSLFTILKFFTFGILLAGTIFSLQYFFGNVSLKVGLTSDTVIRAIFSALLAGAILGFLEELVFRGLIMRTIYTVSQPLTAVILSSLFFAYKHFKVPNSIWDNLPGGVHCSTWDIGYFVAYYDTIGISYDFVWVDFLSLAMFGMLLCAIYIRTKNLLSPIALHASLVFMIQSYRSIFDINQSDVTKYFGNAGMTNGIVPLILLTVAFCYFAFAPKKSEN